MATDTCLLAPRPPARPRVVRWGCAAGHAAECGEHSARSPDRRPRLCLNIWARNDTKWAERRNDQHRYSKEGSRTRSFARKVKLSSDADQQSQLFTTAASLWPSRGKVGSVLSFFLSVCLSNDEICLFLPSRTRIVTSGRTVRPPVRCTFAQWRLWRRRRQ